MLDVFVDEGTVRPSWIADLREDQSTDIFPTYDARRTLRGLKEFSAEWVN